MMNLRHGLFGLPVLLSAALVVGCGGEDEDPIDTSPGETEDTGFSGPTRPAPNFISFELDFINFNNDGDLVGVNIQGRDLPPLFIATLIEATVSGNRITAADDVCLAFIPLDPEAARFAPASASFIAVDTDEDPVDTDEDPVDTDIEDTDVEDTDGGVVEGSLEAWLAAEGLSWGIEVVLPAQGISFIDAQGSGSEPCDIDRSVYPSDNELVFGGGDRFWYGFPSTLDSDLAQQLQQQASQNGLPANFVAQNISGGKFVFPGGTETRSSLFVQSLEVNAQGAVVADAQGQGQPVPITSWFTDGKPNPGYYILNDSLVYGLLD